MSSIFKIMRTHLQQQGQRRTNSHVAIAVTHSLARDRAELDTSSGCKRVRGRDVSKHRRIHKLLLLVVKWRGGGEAYLDDIFIIPNRRGKGKGGA
jgi:hypothetical protein